MIPAIVVFPHPGGPQRIMEKTRSFSTAWRRVVPFPMACFCPTSSSSVSGRILSASGFACSSFSLAPYSKISKFQTSLFTLYQHSHKLMVQHTPDGTAGLAALSFAKHKSDRRLIQSSFVANLVYQISFI